MLLKSVLTSALLALSLGSEAVEAKDSKFGRMSKIVRDPLEKAKHAAEAARCHHHKGGHNSDGYRFLNEKTRREY